MIRVEALNVRIGQLNPVVSTSTQLTAARQAAEKRFTLAEEQQRRERHREMLRGSVDKSLSPYETELRNIAVDAEARRIGALPGSYSARLKRVGLEDGVYTQKGFLTAEDGKPYPFEITYRTEGRGNIGEEGGRMVTPITYTRLLTTGTDFPPRELRGDDLRIDLKDGKIDEVSILVSRYLWEMNGTTLLTPEEVKDVSDILDTGFVAPKPTQSLEEEDALMVSLNFVSLQAQQDGEKQDPKVVVRHHISYGWTPKAFEYRFDPLENQFRRWDYRWQRGAYEIEKFTSLLQSTLRVIPATPIKI